MSKSSSQRNDVFSLLPYAYHEAGHAVVGHVIGRLIVLVSVKHAASYRGCCRFDVYGESTHHHDQWQKGRHNPELPTILYAGTVAVSLLCEQRGWDDEVLGTSSRQDEAEIEQLSREMFEDTAQRTCIGYLGYPFQNKQGKSCMENFACDVDKEDKIGGVVIITSLL